MTSFTALAAQLSIWNNQFVHFFPITLRVDKKPFSVLLYSSKSLRVRPRNRLFLRLRPSLSLSFNQLRKTVRRDNV